MCMSVIKLAQNCMLIRISCQLQNVIKICLVEHHSVTQMVPNGYKNGFKQSWCRNLCFLLPFCWMRYNTSVTFLIISQGLSQSICSFGLLPFFFLMKRTEQPNFIPRFVRFGVHSVVIQAFLPLAFNS